MISHWLRAGLPRLRAAALAALHLRHPDCRTAASLDDRGWSRLLNYCDRSGLTFFAADRLREVLPLWVAERAARDLERNRQRLRELRDLQQAVAARLHDAAIPFIILKGLTQAALSGLPADRRVQYDIDILTSPDQAACAAAELSPLGFEPFAVMEPFPTDHLPALIRKTGWQFRGDYFDPAIPVSIEIHFQLWDERFSRLSAPGIERFWERRVASALVPVDALAYTSLHLLKHLLQGSVRPFHVYELAAMLERNCDDAALWSAWTQSHDPQLRRLEILGFRLAEQWFGCRMPEAVEEDWRRLPDRVRMWFAKFALAAAGPANKAELWLHCALLGRRRDRVAVIRRRLLPLRLPPPVDGVYLDARALTWRRRLLRMARQAGFVAGRITLHAAAGLRLGGSGVRWWWNLRTRGS